MGSLCGEHIEIVGGNFLSGNIRVHGSKNAVLPIMAASILNGAGNIIEDCPNLSDVRVTLDILDALGCKTQYENNTAYIDSSSITKTAVPFELMQKMRSSVIFLGALAARCKEAHLCLPGGCALGLRPIDLHLQALRELGMEIEEDGFCLHCYAKHLHPADIHLAFPSVGATENAILAATAIEGTTRIYGAAREPEIEDLLLFLREQGACAFSDGKGCVTIEGNQPWHSVCHRVIPDRILAATMIAAVVTCGGDVRIDNINAAHMQALLQTFEQMGAQWEMEASAMRIRASRKARNVHIETAPYPGFATDAQSVCMAVLAKAEGQSTITENIFEARFRLAAELEKMGAKIKICENTAWITGVNKLFGADVEATDLRAGAALCVAALSAEGKSRVFSAHHIDRGYESWVDMLCSVGANARKG